MRRLQEEMKNGQYRQAYLLYGPETYLRNQYRDRLLGALVAKGDTMNLTSFRGKNISAGEVIDLAETMPFFADRRVILIEDSGWFKKGGEQMAEYLKAPAESVCLLCVETEVDKRSRMYKAVKEIGTVAEFPVQDEATLKKWILGKIKKEHKSIREQSLELFLSKTGTNMENISRELEKLFCYTLDRDVITDQDIEQICTGQVTGKIFDMVEAIALRHQQEALRLYYDLVAVREPPMRILYLIGRQFGLLLQVKEMRAKGQDNRVIAEKTGLRGFVVNKYVTQASRFSTGELKKALGECAGTEEAVKTGRISDTLGVELLIIRCSAA